MLPFPIEDPAVRSSVTNHPFNFGPFLRGADLDGTTVVYSNPFAVGIGEGASMEMLETGESDLAFHPSHSFHPPQHVKPLFYSSHLNLQ